MTQYPRLARLLDKIRPGIYVIAGGLVAYIVLRLFAPDQVELVTFVAFFSNMIGLTMVGLGVISSFKPARKDLSSEASEADTPFARANFTSWMLSASKLPPEIEGAEYCEAVEMAKTIPNQIQTAECWSSPVKLGGNTGYSARAYFGFANGRVGFAMVFGKPGFWHQGYTLVADYEQEGSVFTLRNPFGDLSAWGLDGTRFIFCREEGGSVFARLPSTRFTAPEPYSFPAILKPLLGVE